MCLTSLFLTLWIIKDNSLFCSVCSTLDLTSIGLYWVFSAWVWKIPFFLLFHAWFCTVFSRFSPCGSRPGNPKTWKIRSPLLRVLCYFLSLSSFFTKPASQPPQNTRKDGKKADTLETVDDGARLGLRWNSSIFRPLHWACHGPNGGYQNDVMRICGSPRRLGPFFLATREKRGENVAKFTRSHARTNASL